MEVWAQPVAWRASAAGNSCHDERYGLISLPGRHDASMVERASERLVGVQEVADEIWLVSLMEYELGFSGQDEGRAQPAPNPFIPKVLPMSSV